MHTNETNITKVGMFSMTVMLILSCSPSSSSVDNSKKTTPQQAAAAKPFDPGTPAQTTFDFQKECGISQEKMDDANAVLVSGTYTSFPIIVVGHDNTYGVDYRIILQAKVNINATPKTSTVQVTPSVVSTESAAGGIVGMFAPGIVASTAQAKAKAQVQTNTSTPLATKDWLKLTGPNGNPEMKDMLCAATGSTAIKSDRGEGLLTATFSPALINTVSPLAPIERLRLEIGSGRVFHVTANVTAVPPTPSGQTPDPNFVVGQQSGTISIHEVQPTLSVVNNDAGINSTITGDIAYEVVNKFPNGAYSVGLASRTVYLIKNNTLLAIENDDDRPDPSTGQTMPPTILVKDK